ncbi:hypothetical protein ANO14919_106900 [Xylariales sp. No.14919]|nr:hypothetical protein ANO14919_106900 [Xylariales sp. No.14919]
MHPTKKEQTRARLANAAHRKPRETPKISIYKSNTDNRKDVVEIAQKNWETKNI